MDYYSVLVPLSGSAVTTRSSQNPLHYTFAPDLELGAPCHVIGRSTLIIFSNVSSLPISSNSLPFISNVLPFSYYSSLITDENMASVTCFRAVSSAPRRLAGMSLRQQATLLIEEAGQDLELEMKGSSTNFDERGC